jgi:vacuolar-type H+-ATPase subunit I/STV1
MMRKRQQGGSDDDPGNSLADYAVPTLASILSYPAAATAVALVDERELLLALGVLLTLYAPAIQQVAHWWFLRDDGRIDAFERFWLYVLSFLGWLFYFFTLQMVLGIATELVVAWPMPNVLELLLYAAVMLVLILALVPRFVPQSPAARK